MMRHFPKRLARWRGARARLWTLTSGHPVLTILLTMDEVPGGLMIYCGSPERIEAPRHWDSSDIQIELDAGLFRVVDHGARVLISECSVGLREFDSIDWGALTEHEGVPGDS
ncbi:hypothetical protein OJ996_23380 [Luteolibacter sp. GHJ8]|uniref:Uncharacterized protein n=1 Tax=Luteolibacter rhizosphaerae TaxID=2989719 RepID=A0ABT3G9M7_9BACT|nr:hypothetical protein [Luteolibacter rhizosphaerae]MCW1916549.1 hypothetical protein [Luteolibacter rhizosphaerae]